MLTDFQHISITTKKKTLSEKDFDLIYGTTLLWCYKFNII